jgi:hypothetical protein
MAQMHYHTDTPKPAQTNGKAPCSCEEPKPSTTCCELVCPERPRYFCGHLLTDADLSKEQRYIIEKHKLYHRSLHGHGVVCGLGLTCHPDCGGQIVIGEGYAIDDCGNDLIVCEPRSFDVLKALHREPVKPDPCGPAPEKSSCKVRECYQVTICYAEEEAEFITPFVAGCRPQLSACEATRIRETVRFELIDEPPKKASWTDYFKKPLQCFELFTEGQFREKLQSNVMAAAMGGAHTGDPTPKEFADLFCQLKYLLKRDIARHPDRYNCAIKAEIEAIPEPPYVKEPDATAKPAGDAKPKETEAAVKPGEEKPKESVLAPPKPLPVDWNYRESICALLQIAWRRSVSCALGNLLPACPEPCQASCVVLGTVEIEDGKLVRVCNCPRSYVWSAANFVPVLIASVVSLLGCRKREGDLCCGDFEIECKAIVALANLAIDKNSVKPIGETQAAMKNTGAVSGSPKAASSPQAAVRSALRQAPVPSIKPMLAKVGLDVNEKTVDGLVDVVRAFGFMDFAAQPIDPAELVRGSSVGVHSKKIAELEKRDSERNKTIEELRKEIEKLKTSVASGSNPKPSEAKKKRS